MNALNFTAARSKYVENEAWDWDSATTLSDRWATFAQQFRTHHFSLSVFAVHCTLRERGNHLLVCLALIHSSVAAVVQDQKETRSKRILGT
jgi:hypothetical protein